MKKINHSIILILLVILVVLSIFNTIYIIKIAKIINNLHSEYSITSEIIISKINEIRKEFYEKQNNITDIVNSTYENTNVQLTQTKNINRTYESLLEEAKKEKGEQISEEISIEIIKLKEEGFNFYNNKNYLEAYNKFNNILLYENKNDEIRKMLIKSLYYANPVSSIYHTKILSEINKLYVTRNLDKEIEEIERIIKLERGEIDE